MSNSCNRLPLSGKRFFIDPKVERNAGLNLKHSLVQLGGKVEEFLDKGIHFALTNDPVTKSDEKKYCSRPNVHSPFNIPQSSPNLPVKNSGSSTNKWKDIAKQAGRRVTSSNVIDTAKSLGIKIRTISEVSSWLNKKTEELCKPGITAVVRPAEIKLKDPCLKIEDLKRQSKPLYDEFECFSHLDVTIKGDMCPIVNASAPSIKSYNTKKRKGEQKGFCECCQCAYLNGKKHYKSLEHTRFGETSAHYEKLDEYIAANQLDLQSLLDRHGRCATDGSLKENNETTTTESTVNMETKAVQSSNMTPNILLHDAMLSSKSTQKSAPELSASSKTLAVSRRKSPRKLVRVNYSTSPKKNAASSKFANCIQISPEQSISVAHQTSSEERVKYKAPDSNATNVLSRCSKKRNRSSSDDPIARILENPSRIEVRLSKELNMSPNERKCDESKDVSKCSHNSALPDLSLSRLRSYHRRLAEVTSLEFQANRSSTQNNQSSDDLMALLKSSMRDPLSEPSFLGF